MNPATNFTDKHLRFGWWSLVFWVVAGLGLETLHGFKIGWYLDVGNDARRLMFTLAHAHGSFLALLNIAFALTARALGEFKPRASASFAFVWAAILMPGGFLLGGMVIYGGDPGLGIWLVPIGALFLLYAVARTALDVSRNRAAKIELPPAGARTTKPERKRR